MLLGCLVFGTNALGDVEQESTTAPIDDPQVASAWRALRVVNCDRCHGKDYEGLSAPSIVAFARNQSREMFFRTLLDGDPPRGMPGYRNNPLVTQNIDGIYRYFTLRANGAILASSRPK
jgi:cytochrome c55X